MIKNALVLISALALLVLICCFNNRSISDNYKRPLMLKRDRELYIMDTGWDLRWDIRTAFIEGRIIPGMPYYLVEILYGEPDLTIPAEYQNLIYDRMIVYETNNVNVVGSASIQADTVVKATGQLLIPCRF